MIKLSDRVNALGESKTLAMARLASELAAKGVNVANLTLGEPDFPPFDFFKEASKKAIDENICRYSPVSGYPELKKAISEKFKRDNQLDYSPEQIVVSTGAKQSIANLLITVLNEGDEVILPAPYWVTYFELIQFAQGVPKVILADSGQEFKITPKQLENAINPKTKAFIFSNPSNPTGSVYSSEELRELVKVFKRHPQVLIISDEIYEHIYFGDDLRSIGSFAEVKNQVVTVNGLSKAFSVPGWRLGYLGAPVEIANGCQKVQGQFTSGTNVITQKAAILALEKSPVSMMKDRCDIFKMRRDFICSEFDKYSSIELSLPGGAFYVFPNLSKLLGKTSQGRILKSSQDISEVLLERFHIGTTPGHAFGAEGYIRLSYATSMEELKMAMEKFSLFMSSLK